MIDIHAHILPGLDDGPEKEEEALEMARGAVADGISAMIATPHHMEGYFRFPRETLLEEVRRFQSLLDQENIPLKIHPGCEAYLEPELLKRLEQGNLMTLNDTGKYLLVEFPLQSLPDYTSQVLYQIQLQGITPIIAHPERNQAIRENPEILHEFLARGALVQINAGSLRGAFGLTSATVAPTLLSHNWVHFIATDAHSPGTRKAALAKAVAMAEDLIGPKAKALVLDNPQRVIQGEPVLAGAPLTYHPPAQGLWKKLKGWFS